uniref:Uncharacterized protein n=1 Tax=Globisporangium ultimum (strain ATCC 200006 / CBS 805.95 / DAOM BR144) TaxID=431595 RepID=K3WIA3_GLOUD
MQRLTRTRPLGGQQSLRLHQLRDLSDDYTHQNHLQQQQPPRLDPNPTDATSTSHGNAAQNGGRQIGSRTIEAVLDERLAGSAQGKSKTVRLRDKIEAARGNIHTERSERLYDRAANSSNQYEPLVPSLNERRPHTEAIAAVQATSSRTARRIAAVRRRVDLNTSEGNGGGGAVFKRRQTKQELEWIEKQLQFAQRISVLEKECESWWQHFYSSSGISSGASSHAAAMITKGFEELGAVREQDTRQMKQQLQVLRRKLRSVTVKLSHMRNGEIFYADLQELIEDLENAIAAFRASQREQYDAYTMDEKLLDNELKSFVDKLSEWGLNAKATTNSTERSDLRSMTRTTSSRSALTRSSSRRALLEPEEEENAGDTEDSGTANESDMMERVRHLNELIVQSGGLQGGWDHREHGVFTSLLLKCGLTDDALLKHQSNQADRLDSERSLNQQEEPGAIENKLDFETIVARFLHKCIAKVVTKSNKAVRCHFIWYLDHIRLVQQKKNVINEWKQRKEYERVRIIHQGLVEETANNSEGSSAGVAPPHRQYLQNVPFDSNNTHDRCRQAIETKEKRKKEKMLQKWREEKEKKEQEIREKEKELAREQEAKNAKRKQELLDAKQKVLLYKLQKEQEESSLHMNSRQQPSSSSQPSPSASPVSQEELMERSRQAIASAKAKREKLQQLEEQQKKQRELPKRPTLRGAKSTSPPSASPTDGGPPSSSSALLLQPTKASQARELNKLELRRKEKERGRRNAHDAYIPGAGAIPDVKLKSFGHVPIQPRAVPAWRRNI